jgi:UDP-galactopyranose mutase
MYLIVGAGITGITLAERLAADGKHVTLIDKRSHIGGNCYDYRTDDGILVHKYGPHIFHESDAAIIEYVSRFTEWTDYRHKVVALHRGDYFPVPMNRTSVSQFFGVDLATEDDVRDYLESKRIHGIEIGNSRDVVVSRFGEELYEAFFRHYTKKQWDLYPEELDKTILERLPIRYDDNPYYFDDAFQGLPKEGYTRMFEAMVDHPNIRLELGTDFADFDRPKKYSCIVFTGRIDQYFDQRFGRLQYRCIDFRFERIPETAYQPYPVVNHPGPECDYTRTTEFKHFYGMTDPIGATVVCTEYPSWEGEPSYPVLNAANLDLFRHYAELAACEKDVVFAGRSGTFRYLNMNQAVSESLKLFEEIR